MTKQCKAIKANKEQCKMKILNGLYCFHHKQNSKKKTCKLNDWNRWANSQCEFKQFKKITKKKSLKKMTQKCSKMKKNTRKLKVEIYTISDCEPCKMAKQLLKKHSLDFKEYDGRKHFNALKTRLNKTNIYFPQIFVNGGNIGGYDKLRLFLGNAL